MSAGMLPRLEVVADKHRVEPDLLGQAGKLQQLAWSELFGRGLVSELQQRQLLPSVSLGSSRGSTWMPGTGPGTTRPPPWLRGAKSAYTFDRTSSRKRRMLLSIASAATPSKLK